MTFSRRAVVTALGFGPDSRRNELPGRSHPSHGVLPDGRLLSTGRRRGARDSA